MNPLLRALAGDAEIAAHFSDAADLAAMLRFEAALAQAQAAEGMISAEAAGRIDAVCAGVSPAGGERAFEPDIAALAAGIAADGVVVPALVRQLRAAVGPEHAAALHRGATSQDVIDTSLTLRLREVVELLDGRIAGVLDALAGLPGDVRLMAHTRMQKALPTLSGEKVAAWAAPLTRHRQRLAQLQPRLLVLQLGGPVGDRQSFDGHGAALAARMATALGLTAAAPWHSVRDGVAEFAAWLSLVTGSLGKLGQDVALMAQNEIGSVELAGGGGSSAMAHKSNPVGAEVLVALARLNAGLLGTFHQSLVHENERSGAAWTLEWLVLPQMAEAAGAALRVSQRLVRNLRFKSDVC